MEDNWESCEEEDVSDDEEDAQMKWTKLKTVIYFRPEKLTF